LRGLCSYRPGFEAARKRVRAGRDTLHSVYVKLAEGAALLSAFCSSPVTRIFYNSIASETYGSEMMSPTVD